MTLMEMREQLKKLSLEERLLVAETALQLIREDMGASPKRMTRAERRQRLAASAEIMQRYYQPGGELTEFTVLDSEDFHEEG